MFPPPQSAQALTFDELQGLTYLQVKGSGIANTCPVIEGGSTNLKDLKAGSYKFDKFCMEPTSFTVKEESQFKEGSTDFVKTKLMTRLTYTLDGVSAPAAGPASAAWRAQPRAQQPRGPPGGAGCPPGGRILADLGRRGSTGAPRDARPQHGGQRDLAPHARHPAAAPSAAHPGPGAAPPQPARRARHARHPAPAARRAGTPNAVAARMRAHPPARLLCPPAQMSGTINVDGSGNVQFKEQDGIDYAPVTVQVCAAACPGAGSHVRRSLLAWQLAAPPRARDPRGAACYRGACWLLAPRWSACTRALLLPPPGRRRLRGSTCAHAARRCNVPPPSAPQLPGGERVPFLFSVKQIEAKGTLDAFGGDFQVPSYRGSSFLDPKVRPSAALQLPRLAAAARLPADSRPQMAGGGRGEDHASGFRLCTRHEYNSWVQRHDARPARQSCFHAALCALAAPRPRPGAPRPPLAAPPPAGPWCLHRLRHGRGPARLR